MIYSYAGYQSVKNPDSKGFDRLALQIKNVCTRVTSLESIEVDMLELYRKQ